MEKSPVAQVTTVNKVTHSSVWYWLAIIGLITGIFLVIVFGVRIFFFSNLLIDDQPRMGTITIRKMGFTKGGFLKIDRAGIYNEQGAGLVQTAYIPPGTYTDIQLPYSSQALDVQLANSYRLYGRFFEDVNGNARLDAGDHVIKNILGQPMVEAFVLTEGNIAPITCSEGITDSFDGDSINKANWDASMFAWLQNGFLFEKGQYQHDTMSATTVYTKQRFSGDVQVEATISDYTVEQINQEGYSGRFTLILEPGKPNNFISVSWYKNNKGSFIVPQMGPNTVELAPYQTSSIPLKLRVRRMGNIADVSIDEGEGYKHVWQLSEVISDDVVIGVNTADEGENPQVVTTAIDSLSISCPSEN